MDNFDINFDLILNEIDELYNDHEIEYNKYIKTRQIVPYDDTNNIFLTALYCYSALFFIFDLNLKLIK